MEIHQGFQLVRFTPITYKQSNSKQACVAISDGSGNHTAVASTSGAWDMPTPGDSAVDYHHRLPPPAQNKGLSKLDKVTAGQQTHQEYIAEFTVDFQYLSVKDSIIDDVLSRIDELHIQPTTGYGTVAKDNKLK
ncbi:hypothetical protein TNIN_289821 [Trichonephila inaurata madagascariensis]|uniref:Uncharacterized protein n=1 Tax=Trichonephila inaurata madagascariensis TaxID=2747483 RepID=A0A8X7BSQ2_9ARAC|nr:hypothetical protein TNIN_289821 [Trichonephila inaurata madagascariensis]